MQQQDPNARPAPPTGYKPFELGVSRAVHELYGSALWNELTMSGMLVTKQITTDKSDPRHEELQHTYFKGALPLISRANVLAAAAEWFVHHQELALRCAQMLAYSCPPEPAELRKQQREAMLEGMRVAQETESGKPMQPALTAVFHKMVAEAEHLVDEAVKKDGLDLG